MEIYLRWCETCPSIWLLHLFKLFGLAFIGVALPVHALSIGRDAAPCDSDVAPWLLTLGWWGLLLGGSNFLLTIVATPGTVVLQSMKYRANAIAGRTHPVHLQDPFTVGQLVAREMTENPTGLEARSLQLSYTSAVLQGCCNLPGVIFGVVWVIKGHLHVNAATPPPEGCDLLLEGARSILLVLDVAAGAFLFFFCFWTNLMLWAFHTGTRAAEAQLSRAAGTQSMC